MQHVRLYSIKKRNPRSQFLGLDYIQPNICFSVKYISSHIPHLIALTTCHTLDIWRVILAHMKLPLYTYLHYIVSPPVHLPPLYHISTRLYWRAVGPSYSIQYRYKSVHMLRHSPLEINQSQWSWQAKKGVVFRWATYVWKGISVTCVCVAGAYNHAYTVHDNNTRPTLLYTPL